MPVSEKQALLVELEHGGQILLDTLSGFSEAFVLRKPAAGQWSALECIEQVAVSEDYMFGRIVAASDSNIAFPDEQREKRIISRGLDRTKKVASPEVARPTGRFSTIAGAARGFQASRERTIHS